MHTFTTMIIVKIFHQKISPHEYIHYHNRMACISSILCNGIHHSVPNSIPFSCSFAMYARLPSKFYLVSMNNVIINFWGSPPSSLSLCLSFKVSVLHWAIASLIHPRRMREGYGSRSVCISVCVCLLSRQLLHTWLIQCKQGPNRLFTAFSRSKLCGFRSKRFVQKFWWYLLTTMAFFASWWALDWWKRQQWLHFSV